MTEKTIDPALPSSILEVLAMAGVPPDDAWAEIQYIVLHSGATAVAASIRSIYDDGLLVRHVSGVNAGEELEAALERVAASLDGLGLRTVGSLPGQADTDELFHTEESLRDLMNMMSPTPLSPPSVH